MQLTTVVRVEEPSNHPRENWPITVSVPLACGIATEPRQVVISDPRAGDVPAQRHVLATWPDGSIKWILLDFPLTLAPLERVEVEIHIAADPVGVDAREGVRVEWAGDGLSVDTGPMQFDLSASTGGLVQRLVAHGEVYTNRSGTVRVVHPDGSRIDMSEGEAQVQIEEQGPQRCVIAIRGKHKGQDGNEHLDYVLRLTAYAHQDILRKHYTLINREQTDPYPVNSVQVIRHLDLDDDCWAYVGIDSNRYEMPEGWISMTTEGLETRVTDGRRQSGNINTIRAEVPMEPFMIIGDSRRMVLVQPRWVHFTFPKALHYYGSSLYYDIWPSTAGTWDIRRGMAKTHEIVMRFGKPVDSYDAAMPFAAPVLRPVVPTLDPEYVESVEALPSFFASRPDQYPLLETEYESQFDNVPRSYGLLHFGDAPGTAYTAQGRGRQDGEEAIIWVNNEYDMPYMAMTQFLRTRNRNVWTGVAEPHVWHMMDVDTMHFNPDHPVDEGGQVHHLANHVGPPGYNVDPSHEWVEGIILYHLLTGSEHAREHALALGEHLIRWTNASADRLDSNRMAARVVGWAHIALTALYEFTHDERYRQAAIQQAKGLKRRVKEGVGYLTETVSYGFPYRAGFMTVLAIIGLKRVHDITGDDHWKDFALELLEDQLEHLAHPAGLLMYKQLPENQYPLLSMFDLEAYAYAWEWTRDRKYLERGIRLLQVVGEWRGKTAVPQKFLSETPEGAIVEEVRHYPRDSHFLLDYRFELPFMKVLHELDVLKQLEPAGVDLSGVE
jgi:hypothetical protein